MDPSHLRRKVKSLTKHQADYCLIARMTAHITLLGGPSFKLKRSRYLDFALRWCAKRLTQLASLTPVRLRPARTRKSSPGPPLRTEENNTGSDIGSEWERSYAAFEAKWASTEFDYDLGSDYGSDRSDYRSMERDIQLSDGDISTDTGW